MQGMSERQYAAHVGLSRGAIQKAKTAERLVLHVDGSVNAEASDARRAETTDPSKTRKAPQPRLKPVPEAAVSAVGDTLREQPRHSVLDAGHRRSHCGRLADPAARDWHARAQTGGKSR